MTIPAEARVEFPPEFRSAASVSAAAAGGGVGLALPPSDSAQAYEIKRILDGLMPSDGRFSAILELASSPLKSAKVAEKDTQAFENMGSSTKWRVPKSWPVCAKTGSNGAESRSFCAKEDVLAGLSRR